ncbi:PH domain-containing protein [Gracilimonas sp.]|uniref:PH domain-containing protein n=1 Tax=Gracilimonas sp. TaxID=1974203 RepID=UPI0032EE598F
MSEFKRQHPIAAVTRVIESIKQNFITIIILLFIGSSNTEGYFIYLLLGGIAITLISGVLSWVVFRYRVHEDELQIKKGVLVKSNMYLSKDRIQVIDITEGLLQRMFGLVKVEVKTAGGGTETATISAISRGDAEALRTELRKKRMNGEGTEKVAEEEEDEILGQWKLSTKDLVFAAFTSGNFGLIASILGAVSGQMDEFINEETIEYVYEALPGYSDVTLIIGIVIAIIVISWALSFLGVIFKYSDFQLEKTSKELIITSGLVERKHITVPFNRIQAVRFVEGIIRQPFGYGMIYVESAGFDQTQKGRSIVLVPFIASEKVSTFLSEFLEEYKEPEYQIRPPKKTLWRYIRRPNYFVLPLIPVIWYLLEYGWLSLMLIPILGYLGWLRYQDAALGLGEKILRMRYRVVSRTTAIVKKNRIQNIATSQNPFQDNKDIQNMTVTAASGAGGMGFEAADISLNDTFKVLKWLMNEPYHEEEGEASASAQIES